MMNNSVEHTSRENDEYVSRVRTDRRDQTFGLCHTGGFEHFVGRGVAAYDEIALSLSPGQAFGVAVDDDESGLV
jgi:hypothetical protein